LSDFEAIESTAFIAGFILTALALAFLLNTCLEQGRLENFDEYKKRLE
jgi:hypothetical protein